MSNERCRKEIWDLKLPMFNKHRRCARRATANGLCALHQPDAIDRRIEKRNAKWDAENARRSAESRLHSAAPLLLSELKHLVRLLEPIEIEGALKVPGLATLNGAREAIKKAEGAA